MLRLALGCLGLGDFFYRRGFFSLRLGSGFCCYFFRSDGSTLFVFAGANACSSALRIAGTVACTLIYRVARYAALWVRWVGGALTQFLC